MSFFADLPVDIPRILYHSGKKYTVNHIVKWLNAYTTGCHNLYMYVYSKDAPANLTEIALDHNFYMYVYSKDGHFLIVIEILKPQLVYVF